mmetsp:Transcript_16614/g.42048  ORF Transcript_16614/g.42048 Transcript_16614/m.42048 type:complete len:261 (+) Transcript_16614:288-1070(+)
MAIPLASADPRPRTPAPRSQRAPAARPSGPAPRTPCSTSAPSPPACRAIRDTSPASWRRACWGGAMLTSRGTARTCLATTTTTGCLSTTATTSCPGTITWRSPKGARCRCTSRHGSRAPPPRSTGATNSALRGPTMTSISACSTSTRLGGCPGTRATCRTSGSRGPSGSLTPRPATWGITGCPRTGLTASSSTWSLTGARTVSLARSRLLATAASCRTCRTPTSARATATRLAPSASCRRRAPRGSAQSLMSRTAATPPR